ncbi:MAG: hypothetical protein ACLFUW_00950 [Bacteroidales bacterium]
MGQCKRFKEFIPFVVVSFCFITVGFGSFVFYSILPCYSFMITFTASLIVIKENNLGQGYYQYLRD